MLIHQIFLHREGIVNSMVKNEGKKTKQNKTRFVCMQHSPSEASTDDLHNKCVTFLHITHLSMYQASNAAHNRWIALNIWIANYIYAQRWVAYLDVRDPAVRGVIQQARPVEVQKPFKF